MKGISRFEEILTANRRSICVYWPVSFFGVALRKSNSEFFASDIMYFLMTALGSYGDVHPIVGLGRTLRGRGTPGDDRCQSSFSVGRRVGWGQNCCRSARREEYAELVNHPDLWHPIRGPLLAMREGVVKYLRGLVRVD